ncbi:hypothetical protein NQ317_004642 [Molorchus minor]|uniref:Uncharacterized protein n=1 Tax=Molorchus minor TaxID=1323400 RepID=A0ABQ9J954_9CUCU|nr:hypothetical protein NQ317_004642 [Molorchus minor]
MSILVYQLNLKEKRYTSFPSGKLSIICMTACCLQNSRSFLYFGERDRLRRRKCTMNNCESEEIVEAANIAISNLLPTKSRSLYDIAYNRFKKWCAEKNVQVYSGNVFCWHTSVKMQRITSLPHYGRNILWLNISQFSKLIAFLKRTGDGYQAKILTKSEIDPFSIKCR